MAGGGGKEGRYERILRSNEDLEVQILRGDWRARIQSSEAFLLHSFESYLKQHDDEHATSAVDKAEVPYQVPKKLTYTDDIKDVIKNRKGSR